MWRQENRHEAPRSYIKKLGPSKNLGHAIRQARKAKNLTQKELAAMSGVWQETISKIENGSGGTKLETLFDLIAALDLEITVAERSKGTSDRLEDIF